jgi:hypothetical protein
LAGTPGGEAGSSVLLSVNFRSYYCKVCAERGREREEREGERERREVR